MIIFRINNYRILIYFGDQFFREIYNLIDWSNNLSKPQLFKITKNLMSLFPIYHPFQIYSRSEQFLNERTSVSGNPSNRTNRFLGWNQISKVVFYRLSRAWFAIRSFLNVRKTWILSSPIRFLSRNDSIETERDSQRKQAFEQIFSLQRWRGIRLN